MVINRPPAIVINNATLRDVEAMAPLTYSLRDRTDLAQTLDKLGTTEIELVMPASGGNAIDELAAIAAVLRCAKPILWGPASRHIVEAAVRSGLGSVYLSVKLSAKHAGRASGLERLRRVVAHARDRRLTVALCGEDTGRADFDLIREVIATAETEGASRFRLTDTTGVLHPIRTHALFRELCAETDLELEFRGHDHFGLATANTLAAVEGGATHVSVSLVRRSDGSHAAQLDDVVGAIRIATMHRVDADLALVPAVAARVAAVLGLPVVSHRPGRRPKEPAAAPGPRLVAPDMVGR